MDLDLTARQAKTYTVNIPVYEGPLDLLLQLIERSELDIAAVSLAQVTDQYLSHIRAMNVPADEVSAFLVIAAKLLQIKSEMLLPRPPVREVGEEDPGEALARQLMLYKQFKEKSMFLESQEADHLHTYLRVAPPPKVEGKLDLSNVSLGDLLAAAERAMRRQREKESLNSVIKAPRITIREKISYIAERLFKSKNTSFKNLFGEKPDRVEVVVTFLALLELIKRFHVSAEQGKNFGDIEIVRTEEWREGEELELEFE